MLANAGLTEFVFTEDLMTLSGASSSYGAGRADMPTKLQLPDDVEKVRVGFNPAYFKDALEAMTAKRCRLYFQGPRNAGVLKELVTTGEGDEAQEILSSKFTYAVMPALLPREVE
jgi:DNA polymerase III sliding clamp (beta) subunit (PCNA family)